MTEKKRPLWDADYISFIERLRKARVAAGLTQVEAAELLGQPQTWVSKCELRERRVDAVEAYRFAKIYGVSIMLLLGD